jgi:hypothetical protein
VKCSLCSLVRHGATRRVAGSIAHTLSQRPQPRISIHRRQTASTVDGDTSTLVRRLRPCGQHRGGRGCSVVPRMFATLDGFATPILDLVLVQPLIE